MGLFLFAGSLAGTVYFLQQKSHKPAKDYTTFTPEIGDIYKTILVSGKIVPKEEIKIKTTVPGIVKKILVEPGQSVTNGQVLAKISIVPDPALLNEAYHRLKKATIYIEDAKQKLERKKNLYQTEDQIISKEEVEQAQIEYKIAQSELAAAENNIEIIKEGDLSSDHLELNRTFVSSTISGMVLDVPVKIGDTIIQSNDFNEGTTIATVADMSQMIFEGDVDESDIGKINEAMTLKLKVGAIEKKEIDATLTYISPKGFQRSEGQVKFRIKADIKIRPDVFLRAGYSANAQIVLEERKKVLSINESCLQFDQQQTPYVQLEEKDKSVTRRNVKLGLSDGIRVEILEGLSLNDKVVKPGLN